MNLTQVHSHSCLPQPLQKCCNTTASKISLVVLGLLLLGAAVALHIYRVNAIAVYTTGSLGGLFILSAAISSIVQCLRRREKEAGLNSQAELSKLKQDQPSKNLSQKQKFEKTRTQDTLQRLKEVNLRPLNMQIDGLKELIDKFTKIIHDPNEPLEINGVGLTLGQHFSTPQEKIDLFWLGPCKIRMAVTRSAHVASFSTALSPQEIEKKQEIVELRTTLLQLRQTSYRSYLETLGKSELCKEAAKYYLASLESSERKQIKADVETMILQALLPKLEERISVPAKEPYKTVEMEEIVSCCQNLNIV